MKVILCLATLVWSANCLNNLISRRSIIQDDQNKLGIYDGKKVFIKQYPYMVSLFMNGNQFCGGTILNKKWIITNGDCGNAVHPSEAVVLAGSSDGAKGTKLKVEKIVVHPKRDQTEYDYDFSLYKIKGEFDFSPKIQPVKLPSKSPAPNTTVTVSGYGATTEEGKGGHLRAGTMYWLSSEECQKVYAVFGIKITDRLGCVFNKGKTTLCPGDWGDPIVKNGTLYGLGVAVASKGFCTSEAWPFIISVVEAVTQWIAETIKT